MSTDLLIVGGPTHLRRMTTDFSRKRQISRVKKAEAKGEPPRVELETEGPGLREWFYLLWPALLVFALRRRMSPGRIAAVAIFSSLLLRAVLAIRSTESIP